MQVLTVPNSEENKLQKLMITKINNGIKSSYMFNHLSKFSSNYTILERSPDDNQDIKELLSINRCLFEQNTRIKSSSATYMVLIETK